MSDFALAVVLLPGLRPRGVVVRPAHRDVPVGRDPAVLHDAVADRHTGIDRREPRQRDAARVPARTAGPRTEMREMQVEVAVMDRRLGRAGAVVRAGQIGAVVDAPVTRQGAVELIVDDDPPGRRTRRCFRQRRRGRTRGRGREAAQRSRHEQDDGHDSDGEDQAGAARHSDPPLDDGHHLDRRHASSHGPRTMAARALTPDRCDAPRWYTRRRIARRPPLVLTGGAACQY